MNSTGAVGGRDVASRGSVGGAAPLSGAASLERRR